MYCIPAIINCVLDVLLYAVLRIRTSCTITEKLTDSYAEARCVKHEPDSDSKVNLVSDTRVQSDVDCITLDDSVVPPK